jgi:hypothetical protein
VSIPTPDLKPHAPPPAPGSECCGCCEGVAVETPRAIENRGGLAAVAYRIGDHARFRDSLMASLSRSLPDLRALAKLQTRDPDDFTIGLVDAFACAADVLTFYQERLANESFLGTAVERVSLQEMGKLIGYRMRPGVAAETWLAFTLEPAPSKPESVGPEPGSFVTGVPDKVTLERGLKVQSLPGPDETPQTFETVEGIEARPAWNAMRPWLFDPHPPDIDDRSTYLKGLGNSLKRGDALVFFGDEFLGDPKRNNNWDFRLIESVDPDVKTDRTRISWRRGLGSVTPLMGPTRGNAQVHVLRRRAAVFGHNAPKLDGIEWTTFTLSPQASIGSGDFVDLDIVAPDVRGGYAVLAKGVFDYPSEPTSTDTYVELYKVNSVAETSRADYAISGKVTRLELEGQNFSVFEGRVRETTVFAASERLEFADHPVTDPVAGDRVPVNAGADGLEPGRRLIVRGKRTRDNTEIVFQAMLVRAIPGVGARCELQIDPSLPEELVRDSVVVYANVALASHGESVSQILGAGDASQAFQRFELKQAPLTYRSAENELGAAADLTVRVSDVEWKERSSLFGADANARAYSLRTDEQGRRFVVFGDGVRGARLPSGVNNVRAQYRKGLGIDGNVAAEKLTQLMSRPLGLKGASNPIAAEGGSDPEAASEARLSIPLSTRTLGRTVSVLDYEDFARAFAGIAKAQAAVLHLGGGPTVVITLAAPAGVALTEDSPVWDKLLAALAAGGDPHVPVTLLSHQAGNFRVGLRVKRDPAYLAAKVLAGVEAALRERFGFAARQLGQPVQQSEVIAVAQSVPGVIAVDINRLYGGANLAQQTAVPHVRLLASRMHVQNGAARPAELLTLAPGPLDQLEEMT